MITATENFPLQNQRVNFNDVEKRMGFNYENTNPIVVLRSHFLPDDSTCLLERNGGEPLLPFAAGKQYLLRSFDHSFNLEESKIMSFSNKIMEAGHQAKQALENGSKQMSRKLAIPMEE